MVYCVNRVCSTLCCFGFVDRELILGCLVCLLDFVVKLNWCCYAVCIWSDWVVVVVTSCTWNEGPKKKASIILQRFCILSVCLCYQGKCLQNQFALASFLLVLLTRVVFELFGKFIFLRNVLCVFFYREKDMLVVQWPRIRPSPNLSNARGEGMLVVRIFICSLFFFHISQFCGWYIFLSPGTPTRKDCCFTQWL